jgi:hypothetical protein
VPPAVASSLGPHASSPTGLLLRVPCSHYLQAGIQEEEKRPRPTLSRTVSLAGGPVTADLAVRGAHVEVAPGNLARSHHRPPPFLMLRQRERRAAERRPRQTDDATPSRACFPFRPARAQQSKAKQSKRVLPRPETSPTRPPPPFLLLRARRSCFLALLPRAPAVHAGNLRDPAPRRPARSLRGGRRQWLPRSR